MLDKIKGYKTYGFALILAGATAAHYLGFINDQIYQAIVGIASGGGLASLRSAIKPEVK